MRRLVPSIFVYGEYFEIIDQLNQQYNVVISRNYSPIATVRGLTLKEAAAIAGISIGTFKKAQNEGKFPKPTLPGKRYDAFLLHNAMNRLSGIGDQQALTPLDGWRASKGACSSERH
jgi:predicted DNA-binding transcriptional regulator AlpA